MIVASDGVVEVKLLQNDREPGSRQPGEAEQLPLVVVSFEGEQEGTVGVYFSQRGLARRSEMNDRATRKRTFRGQATGSSG